MTKKNIHSLTGIVAAAAAVASVSVAAPATAARSSFASAKGAYLRGVRALEKGKIDKAHKSLRRAVRAMPSFPPAHIALGHIAMHRQEYEQALLEYTTARDGYRNLGAEVAALETERYAQARDSIVTLEEEINNLRNPSTALFKGLPESERVQRLAQLEGRLQQLQAIRLPGTHDSEEPPGEIHFYVGNALFRLGRLDEAVDAWATCSEVTPDFPLVYNNLAFGYWKKGDPERAAEYLDRAERLGFELNPNFKLDVARSLALARSQAGRPKAAVTVEQTEPGEDDEAATPHESRPDPGPGSD